MKIIRTCLIALLILSIHPILFSQTNGGTQPTAFGQKIIELTERIENDEQLQVGGLNPDSVPSLPIGIVRKIGQTVYCVAIDSAVFKTDGAYFSAFMSVDLPGANRKLAFAAKDVYFNPKGVLLNQGVKMELVSDHLIHLGANIDLYLPGDGSNYVLFDCNGYKSIRLKGEFRIKGNILEPTTAGATHVTATLDVQVADIQNIYANINFSPFRVKGLNDFKFDIQNAAVDMSDFVSPSGLPSALSGSDPNLWRGFHLKALTVTLPRKISDKSGSNTQIGVHDLYIDNSGITGFVFANNVLATNQGDMSGWGFSISKIELGFQANQLTSGVLFGDITVPPMDDNQLTYKAFITQAAANDVDYTFVAGFTNQITMNCSALNAKFNLNPTSTLTVTDQNAQDKFVVNLLLTGNVDFNNADAVVDNIPFSNIGLSSVKPYFTGGSFGITFNNQSSNLANFPLQINSIYLEFNGTQKVGVKLGLSLTLGNDGADAAFKFNATTSIKFVATADFQGNDGYHLQFDQLVVDAINIQANTSAFSFNGTIIFKNNDPTFGKLFYGALDFEIKNLMSGPVQFRAGFGRINTGTPYKYWFVDAKVPVNIPISSQLTINRIIGGASYHVQENFTESQLMGNVRNVPSTVQAPDLTAAIPFTPNIGIGIGVKMGVGIRHNTSEETFNGDIILAVSFNTTGGFNEIRLRGEAFMLVKVSERYDPNVQNRIAGNVDISYNFNTKQFLVTSYAQAKFASALTGALYIEIAAGPGNDWHIWFGRAALNQRAYLASTFYGIGDLTYRCYMMFGTQIDPIPNMPGHITQLFPNLPQGNSVVSSNTSALANGVGLVAGATADLAVYQRTNDPVFGWYGYLDAFVEVGFDALLQPVTGYCNGDPKGLNGRYLTGHLYVYGNIKAGALRYKNDGSVQVKQLVDIVMAGVVIAEFPRPTKFTGAVFVSYHCIFDWAFAVSISRGGNC